METPPDAIDPLTLAQARWQAGDLLSTDLSDVATNLIQAGHDCPALWELASTDRSDLPWDGPPLFERAMRELGRESLSVEDAAVVVVARGAAAECLAGQITPRELAVRVYDLACAADYPDQLMELYDLDDEYGAGGVTKTISTAAPSMLPERSSHPTDCGSSAPPPT